MNLLVLFLLQLVQAEVHFGALTIPQGNIISVDEFVHVQLDYSDFLTLPEELSRLQQRTTSVQENLPKLTDSSTSLIFSQFRDKITSIRAVLNDTAQYFQVPPKHNRRKRGLINILGHISKTLFGTATEDDVDKLNDKVDQLALVLNDNMKIIRSSVVYNNKQTRIINQLIDQLDILDRQLTTMKSEVYDLIHILMYLDNLYVKSTLLYGVIKQHLNDLTFTINHILSPNLITPFNLMHLLNDIENKFHFNLNYVYDQIPLFYQIIEPLLIHEFIVLRIPVSSKAPVPLFLIHPFPSLYQDSAFILNVSDTFVAYSNQSLYYSEIEPQILNQCKFLNSYYFCSAEFLTWERARLTQNWLLDLITNTTDKLSDCSYNVHFLSSSAIYTDVTKREKYLVTNLQEIDIVQCQDHTHTAYRIPLNQTNVIPNHCSLMSPNLHIESTRIQRMTIKKINPNVSSRNFSSLTLPESLTTKLSKLAMEALPGLSTRDLLHPTFLASSSLGVVILIAIVSLGCLLRKYWRTRSSFTPTSTTINLAPPHELPSVPAKRVSVQHVAMPSMGSF